MNKVMSLVAAASLLYPNMRIGQLISNAANFGGWESDDPFYCPDDMLAEGLKIMIKRKDGSKNE